MFPDSKIAKHYVLIFTFLFYSLLGWCLETLLLLLTDGHFESRGFIFGPFCIIYGFGMIMLIVLLRPLQDKIIIYFFTSTLLISILEFFTGTVMGILFKRRWWDYSHFPLNLNGHICLSVSLIWGILAILTIKFIQPWLDCFIRKIPANLAVMYSHFILLFFTLNIILSFVWAFWISKQISLATLIILNYLLI